LHPGDRKLVPTGWALELPAGCEGQVRPRSGIALSLGLAVILGTIDSDYRGEVSVMATNISDSTIFIKPGDRIAQLVIAPVWRAQLREASELSVTPRGHAGFGSTGK
jgi:dUTP pyrophosphatase